MASGVLCPDCGRDSTKGPTDVRVSQAQPEAPRLTWERRKEFQTASGPRHLPQARYLANYYFFGEKNRPVLATSRSCCEKEEK